MFNHLSTEARQILQSLYGLADIDPAFEPPKEMAHGDVASSVALRIAKTVGKNPREIALDIAKHMADSPSVLAVDVAGPGYVNIFLSPSALLNELAHAATHIQPSEETDKKNPVIVDFCGPNIAKPLGVHHLGSHVIGQAIINILRHTGRSVIGWNYLGDWGTQFGKLAVAFTKWGDGRKASEYSVEELLTLYVRFHAECETQPALEDEARAAFKKMEEGDAALRSFWADVVEVTKNDLHDLYRRLHIVVDIEKGESFFEDKMQAILEECREKKVLKEGEGGALIVQFPEETNLPPLMLQKSDGSTLYATRDLAMIKYRMEEFSPSAMYYVVDVAQSLHFQQLFHTVQMLGWDTGSLEHLIFGRMRFQDASMSTRKGTSLRLRALLHEGVERAGSLIAERGETIQSEDTEDLAEMMGIGAVAYGIIAQNRKMDMVFDWDKMLSFEGNSAPYIQYTHARARSVLRKAQMEEGTIELPDIPLLSEQQRALLLLLIQFPGALQEAASQKLPHKLATYLYAVCQAYNSLYNAETIVSAEEPTRSLLLHLTRTTADIIECSATLLTIRVPDRM